MPNLMNMTAEEIGEHLNAMIIAEQNDAFRTGLGSALWRDQRLEGRILLTAGVAAEGAEFQSSAIRSLRAFDSFTEDNDPHGEHDFGILEVPNGPDIVKVYWKIDLYDTEYCLGSGAPESPRDTRRVLTLLLPSEY